MDALAGELIQKLLRLMGVDRHARRGFACPVQPRRIGQADVDPCEQRAG
jgi:hypothetical protein